MSSATLDVQVMGEVIFESPIVIVEKLEVEGLPKYRFHQLIKDEWLLTGQSSSWQAIESKELDLDQQEDLTLGIIVATERSDIPFLRTA
jgi:hypothetical protein